MLYERVLITGANGLLGQALVALLSGMARYDVLATALGSEPRIHASSCGYVPMDVTDRRGIRRIFQDFAPSVVINCAAMTNVDRCETDREVCWNINAVAVKDLARECRLIGARFVQISTDFVFDGNGGPYDEAERPNPVNTYGTAKLAGENAARECGLRKWAVIRTNVVYGTAQGLPRTNFALWVVEQLSAGRMIRVYTDQVRTPTYVEDLACGIELLVRYGKTGTYNLSGRELVSMYDFAGAVAHAFGLPNELILPTDSGTMKQAASRPLRTGLLILKAETELGFRPRSMQDALNQLRSRLG